MSAFAELLIEARDLLRERHRVNTPLHFDWEPGANPEWTAWYPDYIGPQRVQSFGGTAGEEALRRLVESLRVK